MYHCRGYYESDRSRLGQGLPKPKIKHAKKIGETLIHKLSWGDEAGGEWLEDDLYLGNAQIEVAPTWKVLPLVKIWRQEHKCEL